MFYGGLRVKACMPSLLKEVMSMIYDVEKNCASCYSTKSEHRSNLEIFLCKVEEAKQVTAMLLEEDLGESDR